MNHRGRNAMPRSAGYFLGPTHSDSQQQHIYLRLDMTLSIPPQCIANKSIIRISIASSARSTITCKSQKIRSITTITTTTPWRISPSAIPAASIITLRPHRLAILGRRRVISLLAL